MDVKGGVYVFTLNFTDCNEGCDRVGVGSPQPCGGFGWGRDEVLGAG